MNPDIVMLHRFPEIFEIVAQDPIEATTDDVEEHSTSALCLRTWLGDFVYTLPAIIAFTSLEKYSVMMMTPEPPFPPGPPLVPAAAPVPPAPTE